MNEVLVSIKLSDENNFVLIIADKLIETNSCQRIESMWQYRFVPKNEHAIKIELAIEGIDLQHAALTVECGGVAKIFDRLLPKAAENTFAEIAVELKVSATGSFLAREIKANIRPHAEMDERVTRKPEINSLTEKVQLEGENTQIPVFFATDRNKLESHGDITFGVERGPLEYGKVLVSIPENKEMGKVPRPKWWKLEFKESKAKHVMILDLKLSEKAVFFNELSSTIAKADDNDAFIFLHGYNVSFEEAAWRTAQIAYDVQFGGAPILYSWPSRASTLGYASDEDNVVYSHPKIMQFLKDVREKTGAKKLHLIAHSMGNRGLTNALKDLAEVSYFNDFQFTEIILAAPDIDADIFVQNIAPNLSHAASGRITLYASDKDHALMASRLLRKRLRRAGDAGPNIVCVPGVDTVDASHVDTDLLGHGYFSQAKSLLNDITSVLSENKEPKLRGLKAEQRGNLGYWSFKA